MIVAFAVRRVPHDPRGEWASGIEDGGRFYPSIHFPAVLLLSEMQLK